MTFRWTLVAVHQLGRISNVNRDQFYQYINQQTTYTFRTHDQYRSWTLDKRHRQTIDNRTHAHHTESELESHPRISMAFKSKDYNGIAMDMEHTERSGNSNGQNQNQKDSHNVHIQREICQYELHRIIMDNR